MSELTYREGVIRALEEELERDERVLLLGEDVGAAGGVFQATAGLFDRFGSCRVRDTPISEQAIVGCALGASVTGLRPVAEIMFADFAGVCFDQIANQLAKYRYMTGGQSAVPVTIRMANGGGVGFASADRAAFVLAAGDHREDESDRGRCDVETCFAVRKAPSPCARLTMSVAT